MASAVQMGNLIQLEVQTSDGTKVLRMDKPLAWLPRGAKTGDLVIGKIIGKGRVEELAPAVRKVHAKFHQNQPSKAVRMVTNDRGPWREVGLIVSLTYRVPKGIRSPQKNPYLWHHLFGDHGEHGHGEYENRPTKYPPRYFPMLKVNPQGHLKICRRSCNRYFVTDWLYY